MPSSSDQTRGGRTLTLGGGAESSLEGRDIELSVSPKDIRTSPYDLCANRSDRRQSREGDRWFESTSLRQPVCLTGAFRGYRHKRTGFRRECEPGRDQRTGHAGLQPAGLRLFSLTGIDAVPPFRENQNAQ